MGNRTADPRERYKRWHWGKEPDLEFQWDDPDFPKTLIAIGNLHELHVEPLEGGETDELVPKDESGSWIAFDPEHPHERLYLLLPSSVRTDVRNKLVDPSGEWWELEALAEAIGGKQSKNPYPDVEVQPVGLLTHVVYFTHKTGDGLSQYIHEFGEDSGLVRSQSS